jgi:hypothetical protein
MSFDNELDEVYEFDAPKFYDLSKLKVEMEMKATVSECTGGSHASDWFDAKNDSGVYVCVSV